MADLACFPSLQAACLHSAVLMDRSFAGWAIQDACGLLRLTEEERDALGQRLAIRRYHAGMSELAGRMGDLRAAHVEHDRAIAARDCGAWKRRGSSPAVLHEAGGRH